MQETKTNYSSPTFTTDTKVKLLSDASYLPFYDKIESVFMGFRQCYTEDLFKEVDLTKIDIIDLLTEAVCANNNFDPYAIQMWMNSHDQHDNSGVMKTAKYLYMCKFIKNHMYHESPVEHANLTFWHRFSRVASHQHVRHRVGVTPSQQSQRYVKMSEPECYIPKSINANESARQIYMDTVAMIFSQCQRIVDLKDKNIKDEDIRFLYPNAAITEIVTSFNFRSLLHYFEERCCTRASDEIRIGARIMLKEVQRLIPFVFDNAGPKCHRLKYCPEEHGACGYYPKFENLTIEDIKKYA